MNTKFALYWALVISITMLSLSNAEDSKYYKSKRPVPYSFIVVLQSGTQVRLANDIALASKNLANFYGGTLRHVYTTAVEGFSVNMARDKALALSKDPSVKYVEEDSMGGAIAIPWGVDRSDQRYLPLDNTYAPSFDGSGVKAYIVDSGIRVTHNDFGGRAFISNDYVGDGQNGADCFGHGTHVSGILGGTQYGIAKNVRLYALRVIDCTGNGPVSNAIAAIDWIALNGIQPAVVNISLAYPGSTTLDNSVYNLTNRGYPTVVAAGNEGTSNINTSPQRVTTAILVGATQSNDSRWNLSNFGNKLELFAPGRDIKSATYTSDNAYAFLTGTSMAAPHVAGAVALYLDQNPGATISQVLNAITSTATGGVVLNAGSGSPDRLLNVQCFKATAPATPVLQSPANNATNVPTDTPFEWNDAARACQYEWQISRTSNFATILFDLFPYSSDFGGIANLDPNRQHFWRVRAKNVNGWGSWSTVFRFTTGPN